MQVASSSFLLTRDGQLFAFYETELTGGPVFISDQWFQKVPAAYINL
jgi:hypothetical protein